MTAEIERLAELHKAATKAPWTAGLFEDHEMHPECEWVFIEGPEGKVCTCFESERPFTDTKQERADADLIVALRNAAPSLIEKARRVEELEARRFPIQRGPSIPWAMIAPYEDQAQRNHSQTLKRLAERGGLSPFEAVRVMRCEKHHPLPDNLDDTAHWLAELEKMRREFERPKARNFDRAVALLKEARGALIVLTDQIWEAVGEKKPDDADLYAWTVGRYRAMREAATKIDALLAEAEAGEGET